MQKSLKIAFATITIASVALLTGCSHMAPSYSASFDNLNALKALAPAKHKIQLTTFTSVQPKKSILCRLDESESLPNGMTYAQYIKHALQGELAYANLYSSKSKIKLKARLNRVNFSSMIGSGYWIIDATFSSNVGKPFTVISKHKFPTSFVADKACAVVSEQFAPAVQQFLRKAYANRHFKSLLKK